jgi:hypothetical protein
MRVLWIEVYLYRLAEMVEPSAEEDEKILLEHINDSRANPLQSAEEYAKGVTYTEALRTSYARFIRAGSGRQACTVTCTLACEAWK